MEQNIQNSFSPGWEQMVTSVLLIASVLTDHFFNYNFLIIMLQEYTEKNVSIIQSDKLKNLITLSFFLKIPFNNILDQHNFYLSNTW